MLAQETLLLDRARKAVARRAYVDAIAALDAYDVLAPSGVLVQEARALRVQACADQGKRLAALDLGRAFLAEFPTSPYAKRVKAIVDGLDAPSNP
jgi:outer membrane protein assembly factor BamD (BamD/ComL family)